MRRLTNDGRALDRRPSDDARLEPYRHRRRQYDQRPPTDAHHDPD